MSEEKNVEVDVENKIEPIVQEKEVEKAEPQIEAQPEEEVTEKDPTKRKALNEAQEEDFKRYRNENLMKGLEKQFLYKDNNYYRKDGLYELAFSDKNNKIVHPEKETTDRIVKSMIDLAETKGWKQVAISGTEEFKKAVWIEAHSRGIETKGYEPKEVDIVRAEELKKTHDATMQKERNAHQDRFEKEQVAKHVLTTVINEKVKTIEDPKTREETTKNLNDAMHNYINKLDKIPDIEVYDKNAAMKMSDKELNEVLKSRENEIKKETQQRAQELSRGGIM